ncbi:unnamed protein product [Lota lota]
MSDVEVEQGPRSTFHTYMAEGDQLFLKGEYMKAKASYSTALSLKPEDKNCLVARSRCYLKMGDTNKALSDAETSLKEDKEFFKGLYQKAEALYTMGDLEFALVFYHRGRKLRPELQEFRLGIQKAQEAIENSVGSKSHNDVKKGQPVTATQPQRRHVKQQSQKSAKVERTSKQLLGELYSDKEYLEKLLKDEDLVKVRMRGGERLQDLILHSVGYLDRRIDFWRQQKLIYARERDRKLMLEKWSKGRLHSSPSDPTQYVLKSLEEIDAALTSGNVEGSLREARHVMRTVQGWSEVALPNRNEVLSNLHSCIGNALMDLGKMDQALSHYQKGLHLATHSELPDAKSQALDNIGRVYAHTGKFTQAIKVWEEKIPLVHDSVEKTWLYYEIGRCYLELKRHTEARAYGCRSLDTAEEIGDDKWLLNASVLVAQADLHLGDFQSSMSHFEEALKRAKVLEDDSANMDPDKCQGDFNTLSEELESSMEKMDVSETKEQEEPSAAVEEPELVAVNGHHKAELSPVNDKPNDGFPEEVPESVVQSEQTPETKPEETSLMESLEQDLPPHVFEKAEEPVGTKAPSDAVSAQPQSDGSPEKVSEAPEHEMPTNVSEKVEESMEAEELSEAAVQSAEVLDAKDVEAVKEEEPKKPAEPDLTAATAMEQIEQKEANVDQMQPTKEEAEEVVTVPAPGSLAFALLEHEQTKVALRTSRTLVVLRGLPGSGKSFLASAIADSYLNLCSVVSADDHDLTSADGFKALDEAVITCCGSATGASVVVVDDTNHTHDRLARLAEIAEQNRRVVLFLEPRTEWCRDLPQLVKRTGRGLEEAQIQVMKVAHEEVYIPLFYAWFLLQDKIKCTAMDFLKTLDSLAAFKKHMADFPVETEKEVDLEQYFKGNWSLHCTTKYCGNGKAKGAMEYAEQMAVKDMYGSVFELSLTALFVTPRTVGARVSLSGAQLALWPADAEKEAEAAVPGAGALPLGSRAHISLGCAEKVEPVQTGLDLLDILVLLQSGQQGELVEEMELGSLLYLDKGRWLLTLREPISVQACFSSFYKPKEADETKKEPEKKKKAKCSIL